MSVQKIIAFPNPQLHQKSIAIAQFDPTTKSLIADLHHSMAASRIPGAGLAAIQIANPLRALIADVKSNTYGGGIVEFINPIIVCQSGQQTFNEGCLSVPEYWADVERSQTIHVQFQDTNGTLHLEEFTGLCATVIQHEIDHINGQLFIDHLSRFKRERAVKKLKKAAKNLTTATTPTHL